MAARRTGAGGEGRRRADRECPDLAAPAGPRAADRGGLSGKGRRPPAAAPDGGQADPGGQRLALHAGGAAGWPGGGWRTGGGYDLSITWICGQDRTNAGEG